MTDDSNESINEFMKKSVRVLAQCLRSSFELPIKGNSEDSIFNEFPQYKKVLNGLSLKVLNSIQHLIDKQDGKGNLLDSAEKKGIEDKFNILVEVNDRLLDKCNTLINVMENPNAQQTSQIITVEYTKNREHLPQDGVKMTPKQTIKLLSSVQVERPQLKFSNLPDNSKIPFRPKLTKKPNAIEPLELSLVNSNEEEKYPHPYQKELDTFTVPQNQMISNPNLEFPKSLEETEYEYIETVEQLEKLVAKLKKETQIAVDLEHHNVRSYLGLTCLIQISTRHADFIIDTLVLHDDLELLNEIFTDPSILKIFHGSNSDLMWLQRDFGVYVVNMFDTGQACQSLKFPRKSLSFLLEKYCQIQANKEFQRLTDWRIRPLIAELIEYARTDTHFLLYIYDRLHKELTDRGLLEEVFAASRQLCTMLYEKPRCDPDDCMELYRKSSENFNARQLYALRRLWELRDNIAREEDESAPFVLPNRILLAIAQGLPRETSGVLACCSQDWKLPLVRKYVYDFQKICLEAYNESLASGEKRAVVKRNVLDMLLSKHDRSVTVDDSIEIAVEDADVMARMKTGECLVKASKARDDTVDVSIMREYLRLHPVETAVPVEMEPVVEHAEEVVEEDVESEVEIVNIEQAEEEPMIDLTDEPKVAVKRKSGNAKGEQEVSPQRKIRTTVPFDYEASLNQMKQQNKRPGQSGGKQFQPFSAKKFQRNQRKSGK